MISRTQELCRKLCPVLGKKVDGLWAAYLADTDPGGIHSAALDGSGPRAIVTEGLEVPTSIAVDSAGGKVYWTDVGTDKVYRANLDGGDVEILVGGDGTVSVVPQGQGPETLAQVARIRLVNPDPGVLEKRVDGLVRVAEGGVAEPDASVKLVSGFLESSNVNLAEAMVSMIELARQFELEVRMMRLADENATRAAELLQIN